MGTYIMRTHIQYEDTCIPNVTGNNSVLNDGVFVYARVHNSRHVCGSNTRQPTSAYVIVYACVHNSRHVCGSSTRQHTSAYAAHLRQ